MPGAKQISLANSDVANSNDVFSLFYNPAGNAQLNWNEVGIYYSPAPFGVKELANGYGAFLHPTNFGSFSLGFMTYGFELYRENKILFSYANSYLNKFFFGASIAYHSLSINNYGNDNSITFILGGLIYLKEDLRLGFSIDNPTRATFGDEENQIPMLINTGISYDALSELTLNLAVQKDIDLPASVRFGIDYLLIEYLNLRFGVDNEPSRYSAGIGINYNIFSLDYAFFTHQDLGLTHQFGLIVSFGSNAPRSSRIKSFLNSESKN
ncbi:MAG: hypothetical protein D8M61_12605 [Ignavibacteriae bacterium]|nr:hypothetical protein [Ignavibacteriota bacterium]